MKWIKTKDRKPPKDKYVLVACNGFCESNYQVALWDGEKWQADGFTTIEDEVEAWTTIKPYYKSFW